ncbi:MAG: cellulose biosynthesis cyclic di-GMP-binding regulatory protein BcsB [Myxococcales bacterium]|nr:MAG: cellulose biosynthesis cyclic di-GMP-binding regulatory protein BcsB [Myxococcales bacterium]
MWAWAVAAALVAALASVPAFGQANTAIQGQTYMTQTQAPAGPPTEQWGVIEFEKHLFIAQDIHLGGVAGYRRIDFSMPRDWKPIGGSRLELSMSHSPALIPELSAMTVRLNGRALYSTSLDEKNVNTVLLTVDVPDGLLRDYNFLELIAHQHYMIECEDPFDPTLWTRFHKESKIVIHYQRLPVLIDLAAYPHPIFEERGYGDTTLHYVVPSSPSPQTLKAIGQVQLALGRAIAWRSVDFKVDTDVPAATDNHQVLIGTPQENPAIMALADLPPEKALPLPLKKGVGFFTPDDRQVPQTDGIIVYANHPSNPGYALLIISGNTPEGVDLAAQALTLLPYEKTITGQALVVKKIDPRPELGERTNPTYLPTKPEFTLADLGFEDVTVRGFYAPAVSLKLNMEPDSHPVIGKQAMKLVFSYGAQLQQRLSSVEVVLNGVSIASKDLHLPEGEQRVELPIILPESLLGPFNIVDVRFHLFPDNYFLCGRVSDRHLWATVHKETSFVMPRDYYTYLPDLSFLKYDWFPYTLRQDLGDTALVAPDSPSAGDYKGLLTIANLLGKATHSEGIFLKTYRLGDLPQDVKASHHLILIDPTSKSRMTKDLVGDTELYYNDQNDRVLETLAEREMKSREFKTAGVVEQINSPFNPSKTVLLVRGQDQKSMEKAIEALSDKEKITKLEDNLAFSFDTEDVKAVKTSEKKLIGQIPIQEETRTWVYLNFWQTTLLIIAIVILLYIVASIIRLVIQRRKAAQKRMRKRDLQG